MIIISKQCNAIYNGRYISEVTLLGGLDGCVCACKGETNASFTLYRSDACKDGVSNEEVYNKLYDMLVEYGFDSNAAIVIHENGLVERLNN